MRKLWLDDNRPAPNNDWDVVKNYNEFVDYILLYGVPDYISFDHDLGWEHSEALFNDPKKHILNEGFEEKTGYDCAKWLIKEGYKIKDFGVHSNNPIGSMNIICLLNNWIKYGDKDWRKK